MDELMDILKDLHPEVDYASEMHLIDHKVFDSFDIITLIAEINENFDVAIPADKITPQNFNSAEALYALISRLSEDE